jgi:cation-transporting ATPase 13A1
MSLPSNPVLVLRDDKWKLIASSELVPGDIVSFSKNNNEFVCPADMILLMGNCVVNEAMLTGESTPHLKEPVLYANKEQNLLIKRDGLHVLFAGTKILQVQPPAQVPSSTPYNVPADSGCIGYVLRTGFSTTQGNLMRVILFSTERVTVNSKESFFFILFLLMFALVASGYVLKHGN